MASSSHRSLIMKYQKRIDAGAALEPSGCMVSRDQKPAAEREQPGVSAACGRGLYLMQSIEHWP